MRKMILGFSTYMMNPKKDIAIIFYVLLSTAMTGQIFTELVVDVGVSDM